MKEIQSTIRSSDSKESKSTKNSKDLIELGKLKEIGNVNSYNALDKAQKVIQLLNENMNTPVGKLILGVVSNGIVALANNAKAELPTYTVKLNTGSLTDETRVHIIRFHVGQKSSSSVLEAEKQH